LRFEDETGLGAQARQQQFYYGYCLDPRTFFEDTSRVADIHITQELFLHAAEVELLLAVNGKPSFRLS
jgi:hypothetical protein